jgi:SAM-dependent methyltransferase
MFTPRIYEAWMDDVQFNKIQGILSRVTPRGRVLDLGCGPGFLGRFLPESVALDLDIESLIKAGGDRVRGDARRLPFKDGVFDTVFCIDSLHLFKETEELRRVLSPEGTAIVTLFCSRYTKLERLKELKRWLKGFQIMKEFFVGDLELDAVVVLQKRGNGGGGG